jgi:hypothetical protein
MSCSQNCHCSNFLGSREKNMQNIKIDSVRNRVKEDNYVAVIAFQIQNI